ncbi:hypothetical protein FA95DRAFT_1593445, partial [Auriscalpium vulgare]
MSQAAPPSSWLPHAGYASYGHYAPEPRVLQGTYTLPYGAHLAYHPRPAEYPFPPHVSAAPAARAPPDALQALGPPAGPSRAPSPPKYMALSPADFTGVPRPAAPAPAPPPPVRRKSSATAQCRLLGAAPYVWPTHMRSLDAIAAQAQAEVEADGGERTAGPQPRRHADHARGRRSHSDDREARRFHLQRCPWAG